MLIYNYITPVSFTDYNGYAVDLGTIGWMGTVLIVVGLALVGSNLSSLAALLTDVNIDTDAGGFVYTDQFSS